MPPEMGIAAVSSPKTAPTGTRKIAPKRNAIIAGTGPPPTTIQSPTCRTQPVPMMAPKPMVKNFQSESVFFMPPLPSTATSAFLSAIVPLLSLLTPLWRHPLRGLFCRALLFRGFKIRPRRQRYRLWLDRRQNCKTSGAVFGTNGGRRHSSWTLSSCLLLDTCCRDAWRAARQRSYHLSGFWRTYPCVVHLFM